MYRPIITGTQAYGSVMVVFVLLLIFANAEENNALQRYFPYAYIQHISFIFSFVWNASKQYILRIFVFEYCVAWNYWATLEKLNRMFGPKIGHCGVRLEKKHYYILNNCSIFVFPPIDGRTYQTKTKLNWFSLKIVVHHLLSTVPGMPVMRKRIQKKSSNLKMRHAQRIGAVMVASAENVG